METAKEKTLSHIKDVSANILKFCSLLAQRAVDHDASKLEPPEAPILDEWTPKLDQVEYGTPEYFAMLKNIQPFLDHHYANNRHHPEYFAGGVDDMTLVDVVEMFCDWLASTKRGKDGDIMKSIEYNVGRFNLSPQVVNILTNTAHAIKTNSL